MIYEKINDRFKRMNNIYDLLMCKYLLKILYGLKVKKLFIILKLYYSIANELSFH
uniref:Uncharacterized protein n=1 Tax=viral metagenome TaxID=1070528 RepID=A0A6C0AF22_9ZZZZ